VLTLTEETYVVEKVFDLEGKCNILLGFFFKYLSQSGSRDIAVGMGTAYWLDDRGV
jgi:hypothetical protein